MFLKRDKLDIRSLVGATETVPEMNDGDEMSWEGLTMLKIMFNPLSLLMARISAINKSKVYRKAMTHSDILNPSS